MKKLILLLFIPLVFTCSSDSSDDNTDDTVPVDDTNPVYLDENGVTIKARDWAIVGDQGTIDGVTYTIVSNATLGGDLTKVCTSRITNMSELFYQADTFNQDISSWDVGGVDRCYAFCLGTNWSLPKPNFSNNCIEVSAAGTGVNFPDLGCN